MSYQIVKSLKAENGKITIVSALNNVHPRFYSTNEFEDTEENRNKIREWIVDRVLQPVNKRTKFIQSLKIEKYFDGTPFIS